MEQQLVTLKDNLDTVPAPIKAADTIQKIIFEEYCAASIQERLLIKEYFSSFCFMI